jgi:CRP/FNR family cyclic AMP-dependent transcriptional regulator
MTYRLGVVPPKKRRNIRADRMRKAAHGLQFGESWMGSPLVEERLFCNLPHRVRTGFDAISSPATHPKGAILFVEGQKPLGVFVICSGRVKLSASSADGKPLVIRRAEPGEAVGLPATISGKS